MDDTFELDGPQSGSIDEVEIFPVGGLADPNFTFNDAGWTESEITTDPFGDVLGTGELLQVGTGADLVNGNAYDLSFDTSSLVTGWDAFVHYTDGTWQLQSFGAPGDPLPDQTGVPEPGTTALMAAGLICFGSLLKRRKRTA